ncbi:MAG: head maturation protease, ClpP-related [Alcaligenes aquatilis]
MSRNTWYSIQARATGKVNTITIYIHDEIGSGGVTSDQFVKELEEAAKHTSNVFLSINSPGGDVFAAIAIYNALKRYQGKITAQVDGVAASAASLILMAASHIRMPENTMIMIHNPWTITGGSAEDLRRQADMMDKVKASFVAAYTKRSKQSEQEIIRMMDETTWMDSFEAQRLGFCNEVLDPARITASAQAASLLAEHKGAPSALLASIRRNQHQGSKQDTPAPQSTVEYVYSQCRSRRIPHLAETILISGAVGEPKAKVQQRIEHAYDVLGLCVAANKHDLAISFIQAGLDIEQVRTRLFDIIVDESDAIVLSNLQRDPALGGGTRGDTDMNSLRGKIYSERRKSTRNSTVPEGEAS